MDDLKKRILILFLAIIAFFLIVIIRLIDLQILHSEFYDKKCQDQRRRIIHLAAQRGDIFDRNGNLLATTLDSYSLFTQINGEFNWLARKLSADEARAIRQKNPEQIGILKEKKRVYPKNELAAQLIGFVGIDNQGLSGIELAYDEFLKGKEGEVVTEGDPRGRALYGALRELEPGRDGMNISLTIDESIQYVAEREMKSQIKEFRALSGMCIVMDIKSGEILALASEPGFDPNTYQETEQKFWHPRFLDPYEPGSTFKVITVASGLEEGVITPDTKLKALDSITVGGKIINNSHQIKWDGNYISISRMLEESINTGSVQIGLLLGPEKLYQHIRNFGFGERTGFGLRGESKGIVRNYADWYKPDIAMITFGQSIAVTPIQLLSAIAAIANDGKIVKPHIVRKIESSDGKYLKLFAREEGKAVLQAKVAGQAKKIMHNVVIQGTGKKANISGFAVCGKTGTAQKANPVGIGYIKGRYISSFVGFVPQANPWIAILVIVDEPEKSYWGETVCAPVFKNVAEHALRYFNVYPDML